jgi:GNAT superfamily N-acetyltransferase
VDHLYVHPDWRRRGIGTRLLDIAKRDNPEGIRLFCFQCNGGARAFYAARDMVVARSTDGSGSEEQEPDLEYLWTKNQTAS